MRVSKAHLPASNSAPCSTCQRKNRSLPWTSPLRSGRVVCRRASPKDWALLNLFQRGLQAQLICCRLRSKEEKSLSQRHCWLQTMDRLFTGLKPMEIPLHPLHSVVSVSPSEPGGGLMTCACTYPTPNSRTRHSIICFIRRRLGQCARSGLRRGMRP